MLVAAWRPDLRGAKGTLADIRPDSGVTTTDTYQTLFIRSVIMFVAVFMLLQIWLSNVALPWHSAPRKKGKEGEGRKEWRTCFYTSPTQYTASINPSHCPCCHQVVTRISQGGKKAVPNWPNCSHCYVTKRPQALNSPVPTLSEINYWAPTDSNWVTSCLNDQLRPKAGAHFAAEKLSDTHINQC